METAQNARERAENAFYFPGQGCRIKKASENIGRLGVDKMAKRAVWAEIDLAAIEHNIQEIKKCIHG